MGRGRAQSQAWTGKTSPVFTVSQWPSCSPWAIAASLQVEAVQAPEPLLKVKADETADERRSPPRY